MSANTVTAMRGLFESFNTVHMSTDEILANARAAMRWVDEAGESSVEIHAEAIALRCWEALDARLSAGEPVPAEWLAWPCVPQATIRANIPQECAGVDA